MIEKGLTVEWGGIVRCMTSDGRCVNIAEELNRLENDKSLDALKPCPGGDEKFKIAMVHPDTIDGQFRGYHRTTLVSLSDVEEK